MVTEQVQVLGPIVRQVCKVRRCDMLHCSRYVVLTNVKLAKGNVVCVAYNGRADSERKTRKLYEDACVLQQTCRHTNVQLVKWFASQDTQTPQRQSSEEQRCLN